MTEAETNTLAKGSIPATGVTYSAESIQRLIETAPFKQHPFGEVWQPFDEKTFAELADNVDRRRLDQKILLYKNMVLDGWHRYLACLATEKAPQFEEFPGSDLDAAERVHASGIRRQSSPEQRYAAFVLLCEACPEFNAKYESLKQQGVQRQEAGTPLSTDGQRVDVIGAKAAAAGVGRSTAAKVEAVKKQKPEAVAEIAARKTTANKVLKSIKRKKAAQNKAGDGGDNATTTGKRPEIADLLGLIHRGLKTGNEVEGLSLDSNAVFFLFNGHRVKVTCEIAGADSTKSQEGATTANETEPPGQQEPTPEATKATEINIKKLKSLYGDDAEEVLEDSLDELLKEDGRMRTYKILKSLPTSEEFEELQRKKFTSTISDLVESAFVCFEELAGELGDWYDNQPESLHSSDKANAIEEARSTLENLSQPDVSERIGAMQVYYLPIDGTNSRASRRNDAVGRLQAVVDALGTVENQDDDEIKRLVDELESAISEAEGVDFPGMY